MVHGRGLISVFHCIKVEEHSLGGYISVSDEPLLHLVYSYIALQNWFSVTSESRQQCKARNNSWIDKALHDLVS